MRALYAGSFDPVTLGHFDIISRASKMFNEVVVAIGDNPKKPGLFSPAERQALLASVCRSFSNVQIKSFSGLTVTFAHHEGCNILIRGLRDAVDFGYEIQMAHMNQHLQPQIETIFIPGLQQFSCVSSSLVKEVASLGGDIAGLVHPEVYQALKIKFGP